MVGGLETFKEYFKDFQRNYILIGGAACDMQIESAGLEFRATKDLDLILVVEALTSSFVKQFWKFIKIAGYKKTEKSSDKRIYYRFQSPVNKEYPWQIELFCRNPDLILEIDAHLTPIPIADYLSSLSAILMDDDYYEFTINNSLVIEGVSIASIGALICLKAAAYLNLKTRKFNGETIDSKDIRKHKNDVVRLTAILSDQIYLELPQRIKSDLNAVLEDFIDDPPDVNSLAKNLRLTNLDLAEIIQQLKITFQLS